MRRNAFGEAYCHTTDELRAQLDEAGLSSSDVYLRTIDPPGDGDDEWIGEITENANGEILCYIEADTEKAVRDLAREVKIEG